MKDVKFTYAAGELDQRARATVTIDDFAALRGAKATGTVVVNAGWSDLVGIQSHGHLEVLDWAKTIQAKATGSITIADYNKLIAAKATGRITVVDYTQLAGKKFTLDGVDFIEGVHWDAETSNAVTIDNIVAALAAHDTITATDQTTYVALEVNTAGSAGNSIGLASNAGADMTITAFAGGQDNAVFTVRGVAYTQGTSFTAETGNNETAANLAAAIDADANIVAAAVATPIVSLTAAAYGTAANAYGIVYTGTAGGATVSGALMSGGQANATITVGTDTLTQGVGWTSATGNAETAEAIKVAIDALAGVSATRNGNIVTILNDAYGVAGDTKALTWTGTAGSLVASGLTLGGGHDNGTVTVGAVTLTHGTEFTASADVATTAESLKDAIHNLAGVSATRNGGTITVVADALGVSGNAIALATNSTGITLAHDHLQGGTACGTVVLQGTTKTEQTDWNAVTSNAVTATNLAAALAGVAGFTATAVDNVVTIHWATPGTGGNAKTLASVFDGLGLTISGATLSGGVAATYTAHFDYHNIDVDEVEELLVVTAVTGTNPTLDVTPQYSINGDTWTDATAFSQKSGASQEYLQRTATGLYSRYKLVVGGTVSPDFAFQITAVAKA